MGHEHTTHFDDCGCLTSRFEKALQAERERAGKLVDVLSSLVIFGTDDKRALNRALEALAAYRGEGKEKP